jgi:hypothetical protein
MISPQPLSPIHHLLEARHPVWNDDSADLKAVLRFDGEDERRAKILGVADVSQQARTGVKGRGAADFLAGLGMTIPAHPNSWTTLPDCGLIARLGLTEFLLEGNEALVHQVMRAKRVPDVYPVLRQDAAFALCGSRVNELLLQTCNVDFRILDAEPAKVILTSMAGVGITILSMKTGQLPVYRIWCDGTYGVYLWETLVEIAGDLGGGGIGLDALP